MKLAKASVLSCLVAGFLVLTGCQGFQPKTEVFEPGYEPEVEVFGLLGPGPPYNFVVVERTVTIEEYNRMTYDYEKIPTVIEDAQVLLSTASDTVRLAFHREGGPAYRHWNSYRRKGMYVDQSGRLRVLEGQRYALRVVLPDGHVITGETRVPGKPHVLAPTAGQRVSLTQAGGLSVSWTRSPGAAAYSLSLFVDWYQWTSQGYRYGGEESVLDDYLTVDTSVKLTNLVRDVFFPEGVDSLGARLEVTALDPNYYDYIRSFSGLAQISGLELNLVEGGLGVFGSVNADSVRFTLVQ